MDHDTHKRVVERLNLMKNTSNAELDRVKQALQKAQAYAKVILHTVSIPLVVLDEGLRVIFANPSFCETFQVSTDDAEGRLMYDLCDKTWEIPKLRVLLEKMIPSENEVRDFQVEHDFSTIGNRTMLLNAHRICWNEEEEHTILLSFEDITNRKKAEEVMRDIPEAVERKIRKRTSHLQSANEKFQKEIAQRNGAEEKLRKTCEGLEKELERRTAELQSTQEKLQKEIADHRKAVEMLDSLEEMIDNVFNNIEGKLVEVGREVPIGFRDGKVAA
jgi:PAS domain S-box-containing protein